MPTFHEQESWGSMSIFQKDPTLGKAQQVEVEGGTNRVAKHKVSRFTKLRFFF